MTLDAAADRTPMPDVPTLRIPGSRSTTDGRPRLVRFPGTYPVQADTWLLADTMRRLGLAEHAAVLDLCTGTGAVAVAASAAGAADVTGVDLSRRSVLNARLNARRNRRRTASFVQGDLYAAVRGRRFDLVVSNPPYVPSLTDRLARHTVARCWDGGVDGRRLLDRVITGAESALAPGGSLLLVHSSVCAEEATLDLAAAHGLSARVVARRPEPFGPVMRARAAMMRERGLLAPDQHEEELVVVHAVRREDPARRGAAS